MAHLLEGAFYTVGEIIWERHSGGAVERLSAGQFALNFSGFFGCGVLPMKTTAKSRVYANGNPLTF